MKQDILNSSLHTVTTVGDFKSHKAEIDAEDLGWILQILSTNLYSDPIGSLIREYSSNAWDANVEAGNKHKPIEVGIQTDKDQGSYWYVTDLGPGLSPERIDKVYRKFGKSTKRESNEAIGMMGLGKFSGLSYSDQIYITTRFEGMQYQYIMHRADNLPQIDMLSISPSDLPSGTTIKVFIHGGWSDRRDFEKATREQLAYFENIYFNVDGSDFNDFKLIKGKTFTYSSVDDRGLRIKLGPVTYPIDYEALKMTTDDDHQFKMITILQHSYDGLALNFNIGELAITPNRESLLYNTKTTAIIKQRFEEFEKELAALYNNVQEYEDPEEFVVALNNTRIKIGEKNYPLTGNMRKMVNVTPKLKGFDHKFSSIQSAEMLFSDYVSAASIQNGKKKDKNGNDMLPWSFFHTLKGKRQNTKLLILDKHSLEPRHTKYLIEKTNLRDFHGMRHKPCKLFPPKNSAGTYITTNKPNYFTVLELMYYPKNQWRDIITRFQNWQKEYVKPKVLEYDDYVPTKEWLKEQRVAAGKGTNDIHSLRKANGKILVKKARHSHVWSAVAGFDNRDVAIKDLPNFKHYVIYGTEEDKNRLALLFPVQDSITDKHLPRFESWIVAQSNHKYLKMVPNFIHIDDFMKCKDRLSIRLATMALLHRKHSDTLYVMNKCTNLFSHLNPNLAFDMGQLYSKSHMFARILDRYNGKSNKEELDTFIDTLLVNATQSNMWDFSVLSKFPLIEKTANDYWFINLVRPANSYTSPNTYANDVKRFMVEHCKLRKLRIDFKHYQQQIEEYEPTTTDDQSED